MKMYQDIINKFNDNVNPVLVEDYIRGIYGTLDSLPLSKFGQHAKDVELNEESIYEALYGDDSPPSEFYEWEARSKSVKTYFIK